MAGNPVFDRQDSGRALGILEEQRIVSDAETKQNVEIALFVVEQLGAIPSPRIDLNENQ